MGHAQPLCSTSRTSTRPDGHVMQRIEPRHVPGEDAVPSAGICAPTGDALSAQWAHRHPSRWSWSLALTSCKLFFGYGFTCSRHMVRSSKQTRYRHTRRDVASVPVCSELAGDGQDARTGTQKSRRSGMSRNDRFGTDGGTSIHATSQQSCYSQTCNKPCFFP